MINIDFKSNQTKGEGRCTAGGAVQANRASGAVTSIGMGLEAFPDLTLKPP